MKPLTTYQKRIIRDLKKLKKISIEFKVGLGKNIKD